MAIIEVEYDEFGAASEGLFSFKDAETTQKKFKERDKKSKSESDESLHTSETLVDTGPMMAGHGAGTLE